ncbi:MAG TPA: hypothetical protein VFK54_13650 [Candidatus Limnocylindrales bacterium]|nr:hypothetical protein [Candidatus Limnocylindrales bacterium]
MLDGGGGPDDARGDDADQGIEVDEADEDDEDDDLGLGEGAETVDQAVERVSLELGDIVRRPVTGGTELATAGRPFAVIGPGLVEVRLDPVIAAAALRTPGVAPCERGRGWLRFTPPRDSRSPLDVDRAVAWLRLAHRAALGRN